MLLHSSARVALSLNTSSVWGSFVVARKFIARSNIIEHAWQSSAQSILASRDFAAHNVQAPRASMQAFISSHRLVGSSVHSVIVRLFPVCLFRCCVGEKIKMKTSFRDKGFNQKRPPGCRITDPQDGLDWIGISSAVALVLV